MTMFIILTAAVTLAVGSALHWDLSRLEPTGTGKRSHPYRLWREELAHIPGYLPRHRVSTLAEQLRGIAVAYNRAVNHMVEQLRPAMKQVTVSVARAIEALGNGQPARNTRQLTAVEKAGRKP